MKRPALLPLLLCLAALSASLGAPAQALYFDHARVAADNPAADPLPEPSDFFLPTVADSLLNARADDGFDDPFQAPLWIPDAFFMPPVYDTFRYYTPLTVGEKIHSGYPELRWIEDRELLNRQMTEMRQTLFFNHPELVHYNLQLLPEAPKPFHARVNPADLSISVEALPSLPANSLTIEPEKVKKRHWIREFSASLQFSQAYVSPNWYQGGNNNLVALANIYYNVKLNQAYHPNLLFDFTAQYKLGANNAPDDSIHAYNVSEDMLQLNLTFGVKAARRWYYSFTGQFKTQLLNSYKSNQHELVSSFLSPGELTAGIGMTYNYTNPRKTVTFDASIAPISYNLRTCISERVDHEQYDIAPTARTAHKFGSSAELKLQWKITYNIHFASRLFAFTDYHTFQADWENTLSMDINRFLTTQIYAHARYDSHTPRSADTRWHKLQLKEIFSIGFAYKFSSI